MSGGIDNNLCDYFHSARTCTIVSHGRSCKIYQFARRDANELEIFI